MSNLDDRPDTERRSTVATIAARVTYGATIIYFFYIFLGMWSDPNPTVRQLAVFELIVWVAMAVGVCVWLLRRRKP